MSKPLAVIALSGGMDSCVTAAIAAREYELACAHFNYGQRTQARELQAFHDIANHYSVGQRLVVDFSHFPAIGGSSLTDTSLEISKAELSSNDIPTSYVPFRNANILSACVSWAEVLGARAVFIGAVYEDASGYPDCRPVFYDAYQKVIELGTKPGSGIRIHTPVIQMSKTEIVRKGVELNAPLHLSWSCYKNGDRACGECDSCAYRLRGFREAGFDDPIEYVIRPRY